jgi:phospholipid/cholesterol/gamma-HCH transport system permease protein
MLSPTSPLDALARIGEWANFFWRAILASLWSVPRPGWWARPFYGVLVGGLPLALVLGLALGAVIWMHTRGVLSRTVGATDLLPTVLAAAVLLELAPVGAGLIVAARTGASLAAELAAMRAGEQVDALELLGVSPVRRLVGPRVLACVLAAPLLHVLIAGVALGSGFVAESAAGPPTWVRYPAAVVEGVRLGVVGAAGLKTLVFGAIFWV